MPHTWKFFRAGGFDQVKLESGADLANLDQLDQKLWVALACPTHGLEIDRRTLELIDTDHDGRVRVPEVIAAAKWATGLLKNPDYLLRGAATLPLADVNDAAPEGRQIVALAKKTLASLGKPNGTAIGLEETAETTKMFAAQPFNGDGIVPAESAGDKAVQAVITDIIACLGGETDRSGQPGVTQARADQFFKDAGAFVAWWKQGEVDPAILPLGSATPSAAAAVSAVKAKVDDFFARCRLAAFDARAVGALNRQESEFVALSAKDLTATSAEIASFPIAPVAAGKALPLGAGVNPAWSGALAALQAAAVKPLLGDQPSLTEADWEALQAKLAPYEKWQAGKAGAAVEKLGAARLREILAGDAQAKITALIARDLALKPEADALAATEKLVYLHRDFYTFCVNFVSFKHFYSRTTPAIFQLGSLYLDGRTCDLCLPVEDSARHGTMAALAGTYLAYCDCKRKATGETMQIVAAFTDGDSDNLMVGRNGIFYDRKGNDWDATITKLIDNPISLRQAFWLPYKKLVRMIEEQVAKRAAAADAAATAKLETAATATANADQTAKAAATTPATPKKIDVGTVAAMGVAFGAIFTAVAALATGIMKLAWWQVALLPVCLVILISGPSVILAFIKLRQRNLGPLLDANGWAVNAKAKVNVPLGKSLTQIATLPPGSSHDATDPFAEKKRPWKTLLFLLVLVILAFCWSQGKLDRYLPAGARSTTVFGSAPSTNSVPTPPPAAAP